MSYSDFIYFLYVDESECTTEMYRNIIVQFREHMSPCGLDSCS